MKSKLVPKIFGLIDILIRNARPMSVIDLSRQSGIERSACWRIVSDLCELGYLRKAGYRLVEPGLGMVYLGQAIFSEAFFPQRAIHMVSEFGNSFQIPVALAGFFNFQIVYLYRSGGELLKYIGYPIYSSNLALCLLYQKYGRPTALKMLLEKARVDGIAGVRQAEMKEDFSERLAHLENYGYAMEIKGKQCNLAFPVERNGECFGLAFYDFEYDDSRLSDFLHRASRLRSELQK